MRCMMHFKRPKYSKNKSIEKREISVLEGLLNEADLATKFTAGDDDFPAIDGYIHLLNKKRELIGQMLQVQIKPVRYTKGGIPSSTGKMELLAHAYESSTPVLVIGIDMKKGVAYWAYLSPELVKSILEGLGGKKTTQIIFPKKNLVSKGNTEYADEWKRICLHHRNESNDKIMTRLIRKRKKESVAKQISMVSLESLGDLVFYRTNVGDYPFFDYALSLAKEVSPRDADAKLRYMEILERIYYYRAAEVLKILFDLALDENEKVADKAKKVLLEVAKYNIHILNTLGYGPHRLLADAMQGFITRGDKRVKHLSIEILQNILASSFEGTSHPDHITITFHRGPLQPTPYLQKIRRDATKLLFALFDTAETTAERVEVLSAIFHSFHAPDHSFADEDAQKQYFAMVNKEAADAMKRYKKITFSSAHAVSEEYPVVYEIEHQMAWLKTWKRDVVGLDALLASLRSTKSDYAFYRVVFGEPHDISPDEGFEAGRQKKEEDIKKYFDGITTENADEWYRRLTKVATFALDLKDTKDVWKFNHFRDFLVRIGKHKPDIADRMLNSIFDSRDALYPLAGNFLFGLRQSSIPLWDKYVGRIEKEQSKELTETILTSFEFHPNAEVKDKLRAKDIELLSKIVRREDGFSFLKRKEDRPFLYSCIRAALYVYQADPKRCRALIVELLKARATEAALFFDQMSFALWDGAKWLTLEDWQKPDLEALAGTLIEVQRFDHNEEQVLLRLGQQDFDLMISILDRRLEREAKDKTDFLVDPPHFSHYDAIPHHFSNQELSEFIRQHQKYKDVLLRWINTITDEYTLGRLDLSRLINFIGGPALRTVIHDLIASGKKTSIKKVVALFPLMEPPDFQLCFQIIDATNDKEILDSVSGKMRNMGVMSGAYGDDLYGNGLKRVKELLESEGLTHPSQKVKDFSAKMIDGLEKDIKDSMEQNKKRLEEEKKESEESQD